MMDGYLIGQVQAKLRCLASWLARFLTEYDCVAAWLPDSEQTVIRGHLPDRAWDQLWNLMGQVQDRVWCLATLFGQVLDNYDVWLLIGMIQDRSRRCATWLARSKNDSGSMAGASLSLPSGKQSANDKHHDHLSSRLKSSFYICNKSTVK